MALFGILLFIIHYSLQYYKVFSQRLLTQLIKLNEIILQWGSVNKPRTIDGPFSERFFNLDDFISHPWGDPIIGKKYNYLRSYHYFSCQLHITKTNLYLSYFLICDQTKV